MTYLRNELKLPKMVIFVEKRLLSLFEFCNLWEAHYAVYWYCNIWVSYFTIYCGENTLEWGHMSTMVSQTARSSTLCSTDCQADFKENTKSLHYYLFVKWSHQWPMDSSHKGPVMQTAFLCHDISLTEYLCKIIYMALRFTVLAVNPSYLPGFMDETSIMVSSNLSMSCHEYGTDYIWK